MKTVYITEGCPHCKKVMDLLVYMKEDIRIINLATADPEKRSAAIKHLLLNKIPVVPAIELEEGFIVGYQEEKIRKYVLQENVQARRQRR